MKALTVTKHWWVMAVSLLVLVAGGAMFMAVPPSNTAQASGCLVPPSGLVGWWTGDGNTDDIVGGINGTLQGDATFAPGKVGKAFSLDGVGDFVDAPFTHTGSFTVDMWAKAATTNQAQFSSVFSSGRRVPVNGFFQIDMTGPNGNYRFLGTVDLILDIGPVTTAFQHIAVTYDVDTKTVTTYLNGSKKTSGSSPNENLLEFEEAKIGINRLKDHQFNGLIDEVEIFNRVLSKEEITDIFEAGSAGKCKGGDDDDDDDEDDDEDDNDDDGAEGDD